MYTPIQRWLVTMGAMAILLLPSQLVAQDAAAPRKPRKSNKPSKTKEPVIRDADLPYPPTLPNNQSLVSEQADEFLKPPEGIHDDVQIAKTAPTVDLLFYPEQNYPGKPWSNWGDGCVHNGKYYSAIGDHYAIGRGAIPQSRGRAFIYEYDPAERKLRTLADVSATLNLPSGHYLPGKVHSRIDAGADGWLYYATHRGSSKATSDANHYTGDWILRTHPTTAKTEIVQHSPVPKHCIPNSVVDNKRMIFYGGTAAGPDAKQQDIQFFAYDLRSRKLLYSGGPGPARYMMLAESTGRLYFVPGNRDGELMRFDPMSGMPPQPTGQTIGVRAATKETPTGMIYSVSTGQRSADASLWQFDTRTEKASRLGGVSVGREAYVASLDADPSGRFLYYVPGAHGGGYRDGSPIVQYDVKNNSKKVIAFLHPFFQTKYGLTLKGTYSTAVSESGDKLYVTWNVSRGARAWDCCALTVIHIPKSERSEAVR